MSRTERIIERALASAHSVAASEGAREVARRSGGTHGVWSPEDEQRLREGAIKVPGAAPILLPWHPQYRRA